MPPAVLRSRYRRGDRLTQAMLDLGLIVWPGDDAAGPLRSLGGTWPATVTGSPTFGVGAPDPIGRGITWSGSGQVATTSGSVPTPDTGITVGALVKTSDATAATRVILGRGDAGQISWQLDMNGSGVGRFIIFTSTGGSLNVASANVAINTGRWFLCVGTCDGTNVRHYVVSDGGALTQSAPTAVSITWHKASTAGIQIAANAGSSLLPGTTSRPFLGTDRVLTPPEVAYLGSISFGG